MLVLLDEDGVQRRIEVVAIAKTRRLDRGERVKHGAGPDRQASLAQRAAEIKNVRRQLARTVRLPRKP